MRSPSDPRALREASVALTARLARRFGAGRLDDVEDAVQHALVRAAELWPFQGVPDDPEAWLLVAAKNRMLDLGRRRRALDDARGRWAEEQGPEAWAAAPEARLESELEDGDLRLLFLCCQPSLPVELRLPLTLKIARGFSVEEIASALFLTPPAVAQRIVRAKRALRAGGLALDDALEDPSGTSARLASVLDVIALLFTEGHEASAGEAAVRVDLCAEALALAERLLGHPRTATPAAYALAALLTLQAARLPGRLDALGRPLRLDAQDRSTWDAELIRRGLRHLERSATGLSPSRYHLLAGIAAEHAVAPRYEDTDWAAILALYEDLLALEDQPAHRLNRAIARAQALGPAEAIDEISALARGPLADLPHAHAAEGELLGQLGLVEAALGAFDRALDAARTPGQRSLLATRRAAVAADRSGE